MKRIITSLVAAGFSALAVSGAAQAAMFSQSVTAAIQAVDAGNYSLERIDSLTEDEADRLSVTPAGDAAELQQAVRANGALVNDLANRNVQIGNIVEARPAADGSVTFYLR